MSVPNNFVLKNGQKFNIVKNGGKSFCLTAVNPDGNPTNSGSSGSGMRVRTMSENMKSPEAGVNNRQMMRAQSEPRLKSPAQAPTNKTFMVPATPSRGKRKASDDGNPGSQRRLVLSKSPQNASNEDKEDDNGSKEQEGGDGEDGNGGDEDEDDDDDDGGDDDDEDEDNNDDDDDEEDDEEEEEEEEQEDNETGTKKKKTKGNGKSVRVSWTDEEVEKFLDICYEKHVLQKMDGIMGQNLSHKKIFLTVAKALKDSKVSRVEKKFNHCKEKFKKLKKSYKAAVRHNGLSGKARKTCKFYDRLHKLFHSRPTVQCMQWGFDSGDVNSDAATDDDASSTATTTTTTTTTNSEVVDAESLAASQSKKKPPKYRSGVAGKVSANERIAEKFLESDKEAEERSRKWMEEQTNRLMQHDQVMVNTFATQMAAAMKDAVVAGIQAFASLAQPQPAPAPVVASSQVPPQYATVASQGPQFQVIRQTSAGSSIPTVASQGPQFQIIHQTAAPRPASAGPSTPTTRMIRLPASVLNNPGVKIVRQVTESAVKK